MRGGKPIASGAYGCVFKPQLPCSTGTIKRGVSKMLKTEYALVEKKMIDKVKNSLARIPDINKFVILDDIQLCRPGRLTPEDFEMFNHYCSYPLEKEYQSLSAFNNARDKYRLLQMPDGGETVMKFISKNGQSICRANPQSIKVFRLLNKQLIRLLKGAIIPMGKADLLHMDIKPENILLNYERSELEVKLIDWGLAVDLQAFRSRHVDKPFQFNLPLGCILTSKTISKSINTYLARNSDVHFVAAMAVRESLSANKGHYKVIVNNIRTLFPNMNPHKVILENIASILSTFTEKRSGRLIFRFEKYLQNVFFKNVDLVGFLTIYQEMLLNCQSSESFYSALKNVIWTYLYSPKYAVKPIEPSTLVTDLEKLNAKVGGRRRSKIIRGETIVSVTRGPKYKKYTAKIKSDKTGAVRTIHFGDKRYEQYKDSAIGLYTRKNHGDKTRRRNYFNRHSGVSNKKEAMLLEAKKSGSKWTAKLLSHEYLW